MAGQMRSGLRLKPGSGGLVSQRAGFRSIGSAKEVATQRMLPAWLRRIGRRGVRDHAIPWNNLDVPYAALAQLWAPILEPPVWLQAWDPSTWTWQ